MFKFLLNVFKILYVYRYQVRTLWGRGTLIDPSHYSRNMVRDVEKTFNEIYHGVNNINVCYVLKIKHVKYSYDYTI